MDLHQAAARIGLRPGDLASLEEGSADRGGRAVLLAISEVYELPQSEVLEAAGHRVCSVPEADDFLGSGCPAYCVCGEMLSEHSADDLATALGLATRLLWYPRAFPDPQHAGTILSVYRAGLVDMADDRNDASEQIERREATRLAGSSCDGPRPLIDLLRVVP